MIERSFEFARRVVAGTPRAEILAWNVVLVPCIFKAWEIFTSFWISMLDYVL